MCLAERKVDQSDGAALGEIRHGGFLIRPEPRGIPLLQLVGFLGQRGHNGTPAGAAQRSHDRRAL